VRPFAWSLLGQVILPRICDALISPAVIHVSWYATVMECIALHKRVPDQSTAG
jgi:hypothetical protein